MQKPDVLRRNIMEMSASLLGCGLDPDKCVLFQQSAVGGLHTELCWLLACHSTVQQMQRMTTYKEKSSNLKEIPLGLFLYPMLQAADILLYKVLHRKQSIIRFRLIRKCLFTGLPCTCWRGQSPKRRAEPKGGQTFQQPVQKSLPRAGSCAGKVDSAREKPKASGEKDVKVGSQSEGVHLCH